MRNVFALLCLLLAGCNVEEDRASRVLEDEGYTNIQLQGYAWFGCSSEDDQATYFRARRGGQVVHGTICCGFDLPMHKDCTVRH